MTKIDNDKVFVRGWIDCGSQDAIADIFVYNAAGELLNAQPPVQSAPVRSNPSGAFLVAVMDVPGTLRIVAENAKCSDDLLTELKTEVRNFDPTRDIIHINPVTTLLVTYIERFPDIDYEEAQANVKRFLTIPNAIDLRNNLDVAESHFSIMQFLAEAKMQGGVEPLLAHLLEEMEADPLATHPFYAVGLQVRCASVVIGYIAEKLASGALSYVGGEAFGWVLDKIGIGFPDATDMAIKEMQNDLKDIKNMLTGLSVQLDNVYSSLLKEIEQTNYDVRVGQLLPLINTTKTVWEDLTFLAGVKVTAETPDETKAWVAEEQARLKVVIGQQLLPQMDAIQHQQTGIGGAEGLIQIWSKVVASRHRFLSNKDSEMIHAQFDYFDSLQLSLFGLMIEYYHAAMPKDLAKDKLKSLIDNYMEGREKQLTIRPLMIPDNAVMETRTGLMISPYTIWEDAPGKHFGNHFGCNLCRHNNKPLAKASPYFASPPYNIACDVPTNSKFTSPLMGFSDWRMATKDEVQKMFLGWEGSSVAEWAIKQGYPKEYVNSEVNMFITNKAAFFNDKGNDNTIECLQFSMKTGIPTVITCSFPGPASFSSSYNCTMLESINGPKGYLIPVRQPQHDEIYFY
ncbi:MAG: hypothetical protein JSV33_15055 [bacterium]|nr:MAG: hypothetical protein JSV33_15055 [bacterium]